MGSKRKEKTGSTNDVQKKKKHKKNKLKEYEDDVELVNAVSQESRGIKNKNKRVPTETIEEETDQINMSEEDLAILINRMEQVIPKDDSFSYNTRVVKLNWDQVQFKNYSADECKKTWLLVQKRIRKYRILKEVLHDAKEWLNKPWTNFYRSNKLNRHPHLPKRPLTSYMIFFRKKRNKIVKDNPGLELPEISKLIAQMYKSLSPEKREKYVKLAAEEKKQYDEKMKEFYEQHPEIPREVDKMSKNAAHGPKKPLTPFLLFYQNQMKNLTSGDIDKSSFKEQCRKLWKKLPENKKLTWIELALDQESKYIKECEQYKEENPNFEFLPHKSILTKDERALKERLLDGKPVKPPSSAYGIFSTKMLQSDEIKKCPLKDRMNYISNSWKNTSDADKQKFFDLSKKLNEKYKADYAIYIQTLPKEQQEKELNMHSKRKMKGTEDASNHPLKKKRNEKVIVKVPEEFETDKNADEDSNDEETELEEPLMAAIFACEPEHPPRNPFDLFCKKYNGKKSAKEEFNKLSKAEIYKLESEMETLKKAFIKDYENFLNGLTKSQLKAYSKLNHKREQANKSEEAKKALENENDSSSSDSDSDSTSSSD